MCIRDSVDLTQRVADLEMGFVVVDEMVLAAGDGDAAVRAFVSDVGGWLVCACGFPGLEVVWGGRGARLLVVRMWAVGVLLDEGGPSSNQRRGRVGKGGRGCLAGGECAIGLLRLGVEALAGSPDSFCPCHILLPGSLFAI